MFKKALKDKKLVFLVVCAVVIKCFSLSEAAVERYYTFGLYPFLSAGLRALFGWIPFSLGDVLYAAAGIFLCLKLIKYLALAVQKKIKRAHIPVLLSRTVRYVLLIYVVFNIFWGLNYNRTGIAGQLQLQVAVYSEAELKSLLLLINERLCYYGDRVDSVQRLRLDKDDYLFAEGVRTYKNAEPNFPFLQYRFPSLKASLYSALGHYFGFTGYYNPFTAEAQIKVSIPSFLKPFVLCHEMGHQVGYAKENEANFVSFLTLRTSPNMEFRYSAYFEMWVYTLHELGRRNAKEGYIQMKAAHPQVQKDYAALLAYLTQTSNNVEPYVSRFYDRFLKLNNQPKGKATYNEVVAWLIALQKKRGAAAI